MYTSAANRFSLHANKFGGKMSHSRKKTKKLQKQRQQKRQDTLKHREKNLHQRSEQAYDEVLEDMLPLFSRFGDLSTGSGPAMEKLMLMLLETHDLADEPEMEGILFDPMLAAKAIGKVIEKMELSPGKLDFLSKEEREDAHLEMLEKSAKQLMTADLCQDILKRLDDLRLRLKRSGKKKDTAKVAVLLSFMREDKKRESWPMIGLVQALVQRHIKAGFDLMDVTMAAMGPDDVDDNEALVIDKLKKPGFIRKAKTMLKKTPGLRDYLVKQADKTWEEGLDAILAGDLNLDVYSTEEMAAGMEIIAKASGFDSAKTMVTNASLSGKLSEDKAKIVIKQLENYITNLFTPARLEQLWGEIDAFWKDSRYKGKWSPFLMLLRESLADKKAVEYEKGFFVYAFWGELRAGAKESKENEARGPEC